MARRALVLGDESARHPFLQTLPPHVRRVTEDDRRQVLMDRSFRLSDLRRAFASYCATFVAVTIFFA